MATFAGLYSDPALGRTGEPLANAPVDVYLPGTTNRATLYTSRTKSATAPNPVITDARGNLVFFTDPGAYELRCNGATVLVAVPEDPAEGDDADLSAIAALETATPGTLATDGAGWVRKSYAALKASLALVKADVGLANVDNTSDATKNDAAATLQNKLVDGGTF